MTFIRQVSYLVVRIFRYFMPAEHPRTFGPDGIPSLYPGGDSERISINFWTDIFENLPSSSPNEAEEPSVTRIEWKKNKGAIGHEWLLATIERKDGSKSYLRLERRPSSAQLLTEEFTKIVDTRPGVQKALKKALREERAFLSNPIWVSSQKSMSVRGPVQAQDTIVQTRNATGQLIKSLEDAEVVTSYSNFKKPLYLKDLIFAACTTSQASDEYLLFLQQCYWFSRTIVGIITTHYYPDISPGPYFSDSGKLRLSQGKWSFQINEENRREVTKLAVELTKRLKAYNDMVTNCS
ncbi:unnamed protein product [Cyclocybe aegerita]|uniref:Uncharacterized protein n=1 Tax=Cyclocybe aegerita TaxID=1973307 RepID=A0A8S0WXG0_CYCAE|nr:unnamed protein product [Cyclocybe aegerita]